MRYISYIFILVTFIVCSYEIPYSSRPAQEDPVIDSLIVNSAPGCKCRKVLTDIHDNLKSEPDLHCFSVLKSRSADYYNNEMRFIMQHQGLNLQSKKITSFHSIHYSEKPNSDEVKIAVIALQYNNSEDILKIRKQLNSIKTREVTDDIAPYYWDVIISGKCVYYIYSQSVDHRSRTFEIVRKSI